MKKAAFILALGFFMSNLAFAGTNPNLKKLLNRKVNIDLSHIELNPYQPDFVDVRFKIVEGEIQIESIHATQSDLKKEIIKALNKLEVTCDYVEGETYEYKFTFEKI
ncbi:MAG: hypothetical protein WC044_00685 [Crocinitomicaceae bacterium]